MHKDQEELRTERLTVRMRPDARRELERMAKADRRSLGTMVDILVMERAGRTQAADGSGASVQIEPSGSR
jgi:uncharacterized protein (DUF1778 family)